ncbi:PEP/pyruvate-binding domain-containing protein [Geosporobacter ferrireducens]|uniref:Phosphoenolpyruvate synthase n=1 Tax=Geosporobacter ferrireducens TaxID=1424294 RepID=A0A1D8GM33_9FIRM|nr:PEP/pyruvate-binding domain-containing protein [Geosporobacter ferrireducens]AOT71969.1 phosphoenolpyruvate synthase [Geosporobacter ferrireducens]MTI55837.1 phosphoenolpyruvate synthase [Geosporobacter ferrireducens]
MENMVRSFNALTPEFQSLAGGKGGMLGRMYQRGYPVPEGFVVLPSAFQGETLNKEAWNAIKAALDEIRERNEEVRFAVRSSALSEDSAQASFAGEFETVLNLKTDEEIQKGIYTVFESRVSERVKAYSSVQGMEQVHQIAVVVQLMVQSEISGVLFTADPITGSYKNMIGNYVHGLGEQLVSGEANAYDFKLVRPKGRYEGPDEFAKYASMLYQYAAKLEKELEHPQDIEWAVAKGKLYLLQSRPITTLTAGNIDTYDINYSLTGDEIWINTNVAEAIPDVLAPFTWSIGKQLDEALNFIPGYYVFSGNICGRPYMNISRRVSVISSVLGKYSKGALKMIYDLYGELPEGMQMPIHPFSRFELLKVMFPLIIRFSKNSQKASKNLGQFFRNTPGWCINMRERIKKARSKEELLSLWKEEIQPYLIRAWLSAGAAAIKLTNVTALDKKLTELVGTEDANTLLSNLRGGSGLESLGPVMGISKIIHGEMNRGEYLTKYGHRGAHEYELSIPDPMEDTDWLEKQIEEYKQLSIDVEELLRKQHVQYEAAKNRFKERFPDKIKWLENQLAKAAEGAQRREEGRSEFVRVYRVVRAFALKAGELAGIGNDIFFLYADEVEDLLSETASKVKFISARKENFERYKAMPPFPSIIRGRFNPVEWAKDSNRRLDYYDATMPAAALPDSETLKGCAGAAGRIEGIVRILASPEEGEKLQPGEILVAVTTNIGWTPLFPKAAAIITDIGAPLSHAAIVAREIGIPAVVGCTNATARLKTGDKVLVDGGQGIVQILE